MKRLDRYKKYKSLQDLIHYRLENQSEEIADHFRDLEDDFPIEIHHRSFLTTRPIKTLPGQRPGNEQRVESIITFIPIYGFNFQHLQELIPRIESIILRAESMGEFTTSCESPHFNDNKIGKIVAKIGNSQFRIILDDLKWENIKKRFHGTIESDLKIVAIELHFTQI